MPIVILICLALLGAAVYLYLRLRRERADRARDLEALEQQLRHARSDQRDLFFAKLLGGGSYHTEEEVRRDAGAVSVALPNRNVLLVSARVETWGALFASGQMDRKDCNFILRNTLEDSFSCPTCAADVQGTMVAILNPERLYEGAMEDVVRHMRQALEVLEAEFGITVTAAVSRIYGSLLELPQAKKDTEHIFEYLQLMGEDAPVTTYDELTHVHVRQSNTSYLDLESRLLGCIRVSDFTGAGQVLHELIQGEFGETKPTIDTVRFRVYGVVNTLLYLLNDIREAVGNEIVDEIDPGPRLTGAETLDEIVAVMDDIFDQLVAHTSQRRQAQAPGWVGEVRTYVTERFRDPDLTVSSVADHFGLTSTYCSKVFREQFGERLFDFIQHQRLDMAKSLLPSDKSLKDIAEEAGFSSPLTMNRAFKRYEGVTPTKIRDSLRAG